MPFSEVEQKIINLDKRVGLLEKQHVGFWNYVRESKVFRLAPAWVLDSAKVQHMIGWFLLTVSTLGLIESWFSNQSYDPYLALLFFISIWLVGKNSALFSLSDSTIALDQQYRSKKLVHTDAVHRKVNVDLIASSDRALRGVRYFLGLLGTVLLSYSCVGYILEYVHDPIWQTFVFLGVTIGAVVYYLRKGNYQLFYLGVLVLYGLLLLSGSPLFAVLALIVMTPPLLYVAIASRRWYFLLFILITVYGSLAHWIALVLSPTYLHSVTSIDSNSLSLAIASALLVFLILFSLPFIWQRRLTEDREVVRGILVANSGIFTASSLWLLSKGSVDGWLLTNFFILLVSMGFGYGSWVYAGRYSYAKYFFSISLISTLFLVLAQPNYTVINTVWFIVSVLLLVGGFLINSYSLRMMGLGTLSISVVYYFVYMLMNVLANPSAGGLIDAAWLGILLSAFLLVVGSWYRTLHTRGIEKAYKDSIAQVCGIVTIFIIFAWVQLTQIGAPQSFLWICLGFIAVVCARDVRYTFSQSLGVALMLVGFTKLIFIDTLIFSDSLRVALMIFCSLILIIISYLLWKYPKKVTAFFA